MVKLQITSAEDRKLKNKIMARTPYKMKGHELPGPNQKKSPAKQFEEGDYYDTRSAKKKSPAKCPLVAALAPIAMQAVGGAVSGAMKKKKEE
jgi:hypothetical protein